MLSSSCISCHQPFLLIIKRLPASIADFYLEIVPKITLKPLKITPFAPLFLRVNSPSPTSKSFSPASLPA
jgi:hypothetical protein